ncbi:hypothetical protein K438DRAFT_1592301 [Mycena galopus ATCC 62051]|nr:hypothetical protein K438DRAFT_1592301 [Mycena galopus ATCC 62051]
MTVPCSSVLPPYSPPPPVPSYSSEPTDDEETVESTPRAHAHPTGVYIKKSGGNSVSLTEQDPSADFPTYGRHAAITGFVTLEDRETVSEIVLKVKGKMDVMISEGGSLSTRLVNNSYTIWSSGKSTHASCSSCPSAVPFSVVLPSQFQHYDGVSYRLPPSYEIPLSTISGLFFKSSYSLSVTITRTMSHKIRFLTKSKTIPIPFKYRPRTRPWRPIQPSRDFFSDVKIMPEEFRQVTAQLLPRAASTVQSMDLHLFLPAVEIFGLADTVPFHVQLTGAVSSLREFLPASDDGSGGKATIVGSLVRQVIVDLDHRTATRSVVIGHAEMSPRPPDAGVDPHTHGDESQASLNWDGQVQCKGDSLVGTFDAGCVRVQDFILIELKPLRAERRSEYVTLRLSHPIRLVTESWVDNSLSRDDPR